MIRTKRRTILYAVLYYVLFIVFRMKERKDIRSGIKNIAQYLFIVSCFRSHLRLLWELAFSSTVLLLILGRPTLRFLCRFHSTACLLISSVGFLNMCSFNLHFRLLIFLVWFVSTLPYFLPFPDHPTDHEEKVTTSI